MTVWFTSDLHLSHKAMAFYRQHGYWPVTNSDKQAITTSLVADHNQMLADGWDAVVKKDDQVWVLGDLTANDSHLDAALSWVRDRPGSKHFILGNHDPAHPMHSDSHKWMSRYLEAFDSVQMAASRRITLPDGTKTRALLSHFPYRGDGELKEDRATQFRLRNEGMPLLHGHVHSEETLTHAGVQRTLQANGEWTTRPGTVQIHVGVDAWEFTPVPLDDVIRMIAHGMGLHSHENLI